jgi:hypothetical protein
MHQEVIFLTNSDVWAITVGAVALALLLAFIVLIRVIGGNSKVRETRFGFFIERDRYVEWPEDAEQDTMVKWPEKPKDGV